MATETFIGLGVPVITNTLMRQSGGVTDFFFLADHKRSADRNKTQPRGALEQITSTRHCYPTDKAVIVVQLGSFQMRFACLGSRVFLLLKRKAKELLCPANLPLVTQRFIKTQKQNYFTLVEFGIFGIFGLFLSVSSPDIVFMCNIVNIIISPNLKKIDFYHYLIICRAIYFCAPAT